MNTRHQDDVPSITQIFIGMGIAWLNAKEHLESAMLLLDHKKSKCAYSEWILAVEEFGKLVIYWRIMKPDAKERESLWDTHRSELEDHKKKLLAFTETLEFLLRLDSKAFSFKVNFTATDPSIGAAVDSFLKTIIEKHDKGELHAWLHSIRQYATYTIINDGTVVSPERAVRDIPPGLLEAAIRLTAGGVIGLDLLLSHLIGPVHKQLQNHFTASTKYEEKETYDILKKTLNNFVPTLMEYTRKIQSGELSLKDDPEFTKFVTQVDKESRKFFAVIYLLKKITELSAKAATT